MNRIRTIAGPTLTATLAGLALATVLGSATPTAATRSHTVAQPTPVPWHGVVANEPMPNPWHGVVANEPMPNPWHGVIADQPVPVPWHGTAA